MLLSNLQKTFDENENVFLLKKHIQNKYLIIKQLKDKYFIINIQNIG